jgi:hypothetical protein
MSAAMLWAQLSADGLVEGPQPAPEPAGSPWFVRLMLGIAGWIGALFLLGFVGVALSFIIDNAASAMTAGAICCAGALALFRSFDGQDFVEQFALALSLAGQALLVIGLGQIFKLDSPTLYLAIAAVEGALAIAIPNALHRVLSAAGAAVALALCIDQLGLHGIAAPLLCAALALVWLDPARWAAGGRLWRPIGYGLLLALLIVECFRLFDARALFGSAKETSWMAVHGPLIGRALSAAVLVWAAATLSGREGDSSGSRTVLLAVGAALLIGLLSLLAPGLSTALLVLLLGFAAGSRLLMAMGIVGLLGFTAHFYYSLHATLLVKSGILAVTGLCLLAAALLLRRLAPAVADPLHA